MSENQEQDVHAVFICPMEGTEHFLCIRNAEELPPHPAVNDIIHIGNMSLIARRIEWVINTGQTIKVIVRCDIMMAPQPEVIPIDRKARRKKAPIVIDEKALPVQEFEHAAVH